MIPTSDVEIVKKHCESNSENGAEKANLLQLQHPTTGNQEERPQRKRKRTLVKPGIVDLAFLTGQHMVDLL